MEDCFLTVMDIGVTHIHNLCSGAVSDIAWGQVQWVLFFGGCSLGASISALLVTMCVSLWKTR